mmetsp:Transcript_37017/g.86470  ORF Transcript_37017/g.86470 Transcript_37017/m.86470 type:complete len:281 (-) Transcript_37017:535-1377(-)
MAARSVALLTASAKPVPALVIEDTVWSPSSKLHCCSASEPLHGSSTTVALLSPAGSAARHRSVAALSSWCRVGAPSWRRLSGRTAQTRVSTPRSAASRLRVYQRSLARVQSSRPTFHGSMRSTPSYAGAPSSISLRACTPRGSWLTPMTSELLTICSTCCARRGRSAESSSGAFISAQSPKYSRFSPSVNLRAVCSPRSRGSVGSAGWALAAACPLGLLTAIMSGSLKPPGAARGAHLSERSARSRKVPTFAEMSQPTRQRLERSTDCSGSGWIAKGSVE